MTKRAFGVCRFDDVAGFSADNNYGSAGLVVTAVPGYSYAVPRGLVLDGAQRAVLAGTAATKPEGTRGNRAIIALARYNSRGELDRYRKIIDNAEPDRFGVDGLFFANIQSSPIDTAHAILRHGDNYFVAGSVERGSGRQVVVVKFGATTGERGTFGLDASFGGDGADVTDIGATHDEQGVALAVDGNRRIWVAAETVADPYRFRAVLICYRHTGVLDTRVGDDGVVIIEGNTRARAMVAVRAGVVVAGQRAGNWCIWKRRPQGTADDRFGSNGQVSMLRLTDGWRAQTCDAVVLDENGRIVAAGTAHKGTDRCLVVARYESDGTLDASFGTGGAVRVPFSSARRVQATGVAVDRAGRIVVCGGAVETVTGLERPAVVRLLDDGRLDRSFSDDGKAYGPAEMAAPTGLAIDRSNRVVLCAPVECERLVEEENVPGFVPSVHGLRYTNDRFHQEIDTIGGGNLFVGLTVCGGMSLAARDYFLSNRVTPDRQSQPGPRDFFRRYVMQRQMDSLGWDGVLPTENPMRFLGQFFRLPRPMPWRKEFADWHTHDDDDDVLRWSTGQLFKMSQAIRAQQRLVLTGVVYHDADKLFDNHQILAIGMSGAEIGTPEKRELLIENSSLSRLVQIHVYDPNYPGEDHRFILAKMKVDTWHITRVGSRGRRVLSLAWATLACFGGDYSFDADDVALVMDGRADDYVDEGVWDAEKRREIVKAKRDLRGFFLMDPSGFRNRPGFATVDPGARLA